MPWTCTSHNKLPFSALHLTHEKQKLLADMYKYIYIHACLLIRLGCNVEGTCICTNIVGSLNSIIY